MVRRDHAAALGRQLERIADFIVGGRRHELGGRVATMEYTLNTAMIEGLKGEKGDTGAQGPQGPQGATGPAGPAASKIAFDAPASTPTAAILTFGGLILRAACSSAGDMSVSARSTLDNARLHVAGVDDTGAFYREDDDLDRCAL